MAAPGDVFIDKNGTRAVDKGAPVGGGNSGGSPTLAPGTTSIWSSMRRAREKKAEQARQQRLDEAWNANEQGVAYSKAGDWANAVTAYQEAVNKDPDDPICRKNLAQAQVALKNQQAELQNQQAEAERQRRDKIAAANMQKAINSFTETLSATPATSQGLDFDGGAGKRVSGGDALDFTSTLPPAGAPRPAVLESGDPKVVDARKLPSGLSKAVDDAIAGSFKDAPPGVSDRVRKGFQAVADRDWKVAHAWFQDALNHDPNNAGLKNLVALSNPPDKTAPVKPVEKKPGLSEEDQRKGVSP